MRIISYENFPNVRVVSNCEAEIEAIFRKCRKNSYLAWYERNLLALSLSGRSAIKRPSFAILSDGLYEMRKTKDLNPRILFQFLENDLVILLCAFQKKDEADYKIYCQKANNRLKLLKEMEYL